VLFCTEAGGVGLNLQRAASCVVNLELPWNPAVLGQRIGRVYRLGQKLPVQVYNLVSEYGIESRIADLVADKQALFSGLFDGTSNELTFVGSGRWLDNLGQLVEIEGASVPELEEPEEAIDEVVGATPEPPPPPVEPVVRRSPTGAPPASPPPQATPPPRPSEPVAPAPLSGAQVQQMLAGIQVQRTERGGLRIEAEPEAAGTLAAMFQGMAELLTQAAQPPPAAGSDG